MCGGVVGGVVKALGVGSRCLIVVVVRRGRDGEVCARDLRSTKAHFLFHDAATTEIYSLFLRDALAVVMLGTALERLHGVEGPQTRVDISFNSSGCAERGGLVCQKRRDFGGGWVHTINT